MKSVSTVLLTTALLGLLQAWSVAEEPQPATTPYDGNEKLKLQYRSGFRDGFSWAVEPERHHAAATNPNDWNSAAIRGWIEGWQSGVKSRPTGEPAGDLPAKYAPFVMWNQAGSDAFVEAYRREHGERSQKLSPDERQSLRDERVRANDRASAGEFAGRWKLTLPKGFTYTIEIATTDGGLLTITSDRNINILGTFAYADRRMELVEPRQDGIQDFTWEYLDGVFVLTGEEHRTGAEYVGARLERLP